MLADTDIGSGSLRFAKDYVGVDYHNDGYTHIDAFCHVAYGDPSTTARAGCGDGGRRRSRRDRGAQGRPGGTRRAPRRSARARCALARARRHVFRDDLEAAERQQDVTVQEGDILLVRTGHARRLRELGPWDTTTAKAGLHPTAIPFVAERRVSALGSDRNSDTAPTAPGRRFPGPRAGAQRDGCPPTGPLPVRGPRRALRGGAAWEFFSRPDPSESSVVPIAAQPRSQSSDAPAQDLRPVRIPHGRGGAASRTTAVPGTWRSPPACAPGTSCSQRRCIRSRPTRCSTRCARRGAG